MTKLLSSCSVTVVGLGLMGASLCWDLKQRQLCREVRGVARRTQTVLDAFFSGAVDEATNDIATGVQGADIVVFATPVRTIIDNLREAAPHLWPGTLVIDMGSTKSEVCAAMDQLPAGVQPVGVHPMCGKETAGFESAEAGLYKNAPWVLTPLSRTSPDALRLATELGEAIGACPIFLDAERHDRLVASISHLPFLVASALVHAVADGAVDDATVWQLAAGGFRDTSRVAASDTRMFLDILSTNRGPVIAQVDSFISHLQEIREMLCEGDEGKLKEKLAVSQAARAGWKQVKK